MNGRGGKNLTSVASNVDARFVTIKLADILVCSNMCALRVCKVEMETA